ncbi:MAG: hypothetical protein J6I84_04225 [Bacilli bacterium]|nr:hypothetical protein [Bacilli bacterium]
MNRISTSLEQSRKLLELGLDPSTADFQYINGDPENLHPNSDKHDEDDIVAWSLGALKKQIPVGIKVQDKTELFTCHNRIDGTWVYSFGDYIQFTGSDIDAAYKTVAWLLKKDET